jgi:hypothetical protein
MRIEVAEPDGERRSWYSHHIRVFIHRKIILDLGRRH